MKQLCTIAWNPNIEPFECRELLVGSSKRFILVMKNNVTNIWRHETLNDLYRKVIYSNTDVYAHDAEHKQAHMWNDCV